MFSILVSIENENVGCKIENFFESVLSMLHLNYTWYAMPAMPVRTAVVCISRDNTPCIPGTFHDVRYVYEDHIASKLMQDIVG